jgi:hypothetical protein
LLPLAQVASGKAQVGSAKRCGVAV